MKSLLYVNAVKGHGERYPGLELMEEKNAIDALTNWINGTVPAPAKKPAPKPAVPAAKPVASAAAAPSAPGKPPVIVPKPKTETPAQPKVKPEKPASAQPKPDPGAPKK